MWNDIPTDELKELMDGMETSELHPDEVGTGALARKPVLLITDESGRNSSRSLFFARKTENLYQWGQPKSSAVTTLPFPPSSWRLSSLRGRRLWHPSWHR